MTTTEQPDPTQPDFTLVNRCHALTTALRDCVESMSRLPDVDGAYRVTCMEQARKLLQSSPEAQP